MAYPRTRSVNREVRQGMIDGTYKQAVKDRGGVVEGTTWESRDELSDIWYGICETPVFDLPDGTKATSPYATFVGRMPR